MSIDVSLKCKCGSLKGTASFVSPVTGIHIIFMCDDCQAFAKYLKREELLDRSGGTEVFQLRPSQVSFTEGIGNLKCIRFSPNGLLRWYAACCNMPIANTKVSPKSPFAGMAVPFMDFKSDSDKEKALGPVAEKVFGKFAIGAMPQDANEKASFKLIRKMVTFLLIGYIRKKGTPSPFFTEEGLPIVEPRLLSREEVIKLKHGK